MIKIDFVEKMEIIFLKLFLIVPVMPSTFVGGAWFAPKTFLDRSIFFPKDNKDEHW